jgi:hypothetical protein
MDRANLIPSHCSPLQHRTIARSEYPLTNKPKKQKLKQDGRSRSKEDEEDSSTYALREEYDKSSIRTEAAGVWF